MIIEHITFWSLRLFCPMCCCRCFFFFFFLMLRRPRKPPLFPSPTLFRPWDRLRARGPAEGPVRRAGPPVRGGEDPRREEEGHHRDRAHPAQDRLPGAQERHPLPGTWRGLLHPAGITRPAARLPGTPASEALSRLRHHHHHQPPGGRLSTHR